MGATRRLPAALGGAGAGAALLATAPTPAQAVAALGEAGTATDVTAPVVAAVALLAWPLALWLAATVLLTLAARSTGAAGRLAAATVRRVAPVAVRRAVELALGLTVVACAASPALAADAPASPAAPAAPAASLDWPGTATATLDWPTAQPPRPPATSVRAAPAPSAGEVVVRPGDTLWDLAEQRLAERTGSAPSAAQVAAAWPSWWAANRELVGDDPHLIRSGTSLTPPAEPS